VVELWRSMEADRPLRLASTERRSEFASSTIWVPTPWRCTSMGAKSTRAAVAGVAVSISNTETMERALRLMCSGAAPAG